MRTLAPIRNYPLITLKNTVIFPGTIAPLVIEGREMVETVNASIKRDHLIVINFSDGGKPSNIAVLGRIQQFWFLAPEIMGAIVAGEHRVQVKQISNDGNINEAGVVEVSSPGFRQTAQVKGLARSVFDQFKKLLELEGNLSQQASGILTDENLHPEKMSDQIAAALRIDFKEKIHLLETPDAEERLNILNEKIAQELLIAKAEKSIQKKVNAEVEKVQKEYILRERMKAIEKELGITEEQQQFSDIEKRLKAAKMPAEIDKKAEQEFKRLKRMPPGNPEISYITNYLELLASLPWSKKSTSKIDIKKAEEVLDEDHYGLDKVKQRIIEYLAVQKLTDGKARGSILCFVGPPGTGKTSVGQSIARALDRKFTRISLGGIRDESEIRGHRRTYVGAMPGRIIEGIKNVSTKNPVFMLDEVDKVGASYMGDPAAALLEVLDPVQNSTFTDHYLDLPFDLSDVLFITTANVLDTIPPVLLDRMEMIEFTGYTNEEKLHIAKRFLLPKVKQNNGLSQTDFTIDDKGLLKIISQYTREAGVRDLERKISQIARRLARELMEKKSPRMTIGQQEVANYLGPEQFEELVREKDDEVGVATGLAWTPVGGGIIYVETQIVPGNHSLVLTGQLGDIMKESVQAALTYVRSQSKTLEFDPKFFDTSDIHVHVPAGSIPKDDSSAGVAIAVSLASALSKKKARKEVALTGEITLRGKVLPVGGIKEKVIAAYRSGVRTVIMPADNKKDLPEVPDEAKNKLKFKFISSANEAFQTALDLENK